ncbi:MAG: DUF6132 family protein [Flavobacteriales bacterium]
MAGIALGAALGYAYYYFIGCSSGSCAITSKPLNSTLYGALMGFLLAGTFRRNEKKTQ